MSIVGVGRREKIYLWCRGYAPVLFLRTAMQDTISESSKVSDTVASALQHLCLVIASFCIAVGPGIVHGVQDLLEPMTAGSCAIEKFRDVHRLHGKQPICKLLLPFRRGFCFHNPEKFMLHPVSIRQPGRYFKHQRKAKHLLLGQLLPGLAQQIF